MRDRVGERFAGYQLIRKLGSGSFADVYLGKHLKNDSLAAIKILKEQDSDSEDLKTFIKEVGTLFQLQQPVQHPNIVRLLKFGIADDNSPFIVMDYAPNGTLWQQQGTR